ncbi:unnamed protein product [Rhizoctonia solani]|uniref:Uncharacterized protein n=1 Tax=Rhizoctonia solani TaxID=456999 RepID=A0A8H3C101_9AGAM|nr:unnamed protein product [Rhizoctonia solani]
MPENLVVVIDALDECSNGGAVEIILDMLFRFGEHLPLKFFLSSRPEPAVYKRMSSQNPNSRSTLHLHEIEKSVVEGGIVLYLMEELAFMSPPSDQISQLARLASNFFIYAATAVRYIQPGKRSVDPRKRLATMLDLNSSSTKKLSTVDLLYMAILTDAVDEDELEPVEKHSILLVLWTVVCARESMTLSKIATLAGLSDVEEVLATLQPLQSLLHVSEDSGRASIFHASFSDFMYDREWSKQFYCDEDQHKHYLASRCFEIMKKQLRLNICNLESSYLPGNEVVDLDIRISQNISSDLDFRQHWGYYLQMASPSKSLYGILDGFLSNSLLFWMEVLNLKRYVDVGRSDLFGVGEWLKDWLTQMSQNCKFAVRSQWDTRILQIWDVEQNRHSLSFHPLDTLSVVQISSNGAIALMKDSLSHQVWDLQTGQLIAGPFKDVQRSCISLDGAQLAYQDNSGIIHTRRIVPL